MGVKQITAVVDSGLAENAMNDQLLTSIRKLRLKDRRWARFTEAPMKKQHQVRAKQCDGQDGRRPDEEAYVVDCAMTRPLMSVSRMTEAGKQLI